MERAPVFYIALFSSDPHPSISIIDTTEAIFELLPNSTSPPSSLEVTTLVISMGIIPMLCVVIFYIFCICKHSNFFLSFFSTFLKGTFSKFLQFAFLFWLLFLRFIPFGRCHCNLFLLVAV